MAERVNQFEHLIPGGGGGRQRPNQFEDLIPPTTDDRSFGRRALDTIGETAEDVFEFGQGVYTLAIGDNEVEFPNMHEISQEFPGSIWDSEELNLSFNSALPRNLAGQIDIIQKIIPKSEMTSDKHGNIMIRVPDGKFKGTHYLNKPGLSYNDLQGVTVEAVFQLPMMKVLNTAAGVLASGKLFGFAARVTGTGAGGGAGSILRDIAANAAGSEKTPIDLDHALLSAAFGAVGESAIAFLPVAAKALGKVLKKDTMWKDGALTQAGTRAVERLGIDPKMVTPSFVRDFNTARAGGASEAQAGRIAEAQTLDQVIAGGAPVTLSEGQASGLAAKQIPEYAALRGGLGDEAEATARAFANRQSEALLQNRRAIESGLRGDGGPPQAQAGAGAVITQEALAAEALAAKEGVRSAYRAVEESSGTLGNVGVMQIKRRMEAALESYSPASAPVTYQIVQREMVDVLASAEGQLTRATVQKLENVRKRLTAQRAGGGPDNAAAGSAVAAYDDAFFDMVQQGLIRGDDGILEALKGARKLNEIYKIKFGDNAQDLVSRIVTRGRTVDEGGAPVYGELAMEPEKVASLLLGSSKLGANTSKVLERIKNVLGVESEGWKALKGEAWFKLFASQEGRGAGAMSFSPQKYKSALDEAVRNNPEMMKVLFTTQEMAQMQALKRVSQSIIPRPGAVNYSGSFTQALNWITTQFPGIGSKVAGMLRGTINRLDRPAAAAKAEQQMWRPRVVPESSARSPFTARKGTGGGGIAVPRGDKKRRR